jgi:choline kinase
MYNNKILHSIVLAAGRGSRMDNLTRDKPKCMVELAGKTLLEWQLNAMMTSGVENILVVVGYLYNKIKGNFSIIKNPRWYETNMVTTLTYASKWLEKFTCIISYSDILYHQSHVEKISETDGDIVITYDRLWLDLWKERFSDPLSDAETFMENNGILKEIGERTDSINSIPVNIWGC